LEFDEEQFDDCVRSWREQQNGAKGAGCSEKIQELEVCLDNKAECLEGNSLDLSTCDAELDSYVQCVGEGYASQSILLVR